MSYFYMLQNMWHYARKDSWRIPVYFLFHLISLLAVLFYPYVIGKICDSVQNNLIISDIVFWLMVYIGLSVIFNLFHRMGRVIEQRVSFRARQNFINEMYTKILTLPLEWHDENHSGDTINRVKLASDALFEFGERQFQYIEYFVMFWGPLTAICIFSYKIALLAFGMALLIVTTIKKFDKAIVPLFHQETETQHRFLAIFFDYISNIKTIIMLRFHEKTKKELDNKIEVAYPILAKSIRCNQTKWATVSFLIVILEVGIVFYYLYLQHQTNALVRIGAVVAILQYLQQLGKMFFNIAATFQELVQIKINFAAVNPLEAAYYTIKKNVYSLHQPLKVASWKMLQIKNLSFHYNNQTEVLKNINLALPHQRKIALVGESGSGKSTLLKILRGLYEAKIDKISLDGCDYANLSFLSSGVTLIQQEAEIFENTIGYNLSMGMVSTTDEIAEAMRVARFDTVLEHLPKGVETDIRERGVNLSGGERQRLALARGILAAKESTIILLDEPTSSVDIENERMIYENIFQKFKKRCVISSIHRLHFLDKFDIIYVMSGGEIVQQGTFEVLKQQDGKFFELWANYIKEKEQCVR